MIRFKNISKSYKNSNIIINNVSFDVNKGEMVVLIGPSGCGKTTLLKMINRLIKPSSGKIFINDKDISEENAIFLRRNIGYVIQQTGLFPHMTVKQNIELIPKLQNKFSKEELYSKVKKVLEIVGLEPSIYMSRYPKQLSGGQSQRIGVARAFAMEPEIILMDEPFSAVDPITRVQLQDELVTLQAKLHKTIVFVTHDMDEAVKIADKICILKDGEIIQYDTPENILKNPINTFVSEFVGKNRIWSNPEFIRAEDIMITNPVTTYLKVTILKVLESMRIRKVDTILVLDENGRYVGYATANSMNKHENKNEAISVLVKHPKVLASPYDSMIELLKKVKENDVSNIAVVDTHNKLKGLITTSTLVTTLSQQYIDFEKALRNE